MANVTLVGRLYAKKVDRATGQPVSGKLTNIMEVTVLVDNHGHGYRNNAMVQVAAEAGLLLRY